MTAGLGTASTVSHSRMRNRRTVDLAQCLQPVRAQVEQR
jgi:hypothetical protein